MNWFHQKVCRSDRWRHRMQGDLLPWAMRGANLGKDVLEIGPGPGVTTDVLRTFNFRLTALEIDSTMATALRERLKRHNVQIVHGDATAMPFASGTFSAVVAFTMLHHVSSPAAQNSLFSEVKRVLRPGGIFVGFDGLDSLLSRLAHFRDCYVPIDPETFGTRLKAAGFTDLLIDKGRRAFRFHAK